MQIRKNRIIKKSGHTMSEWILINENELKIYPISPQTTIGDDRTCDVKLSRYSKYATTNPKTTCPGGGSRLLHTRVGAMHPKGGAFLPDRRSNDPLHHCPFK